MKSFGIILLACLLAVEGVTFEELEARVLELEEKLQQCSRQHGDNVQITQCATNVTYEGDGVFAVTGETGKWPNDGFCVVEYFARGENDNAYTMTVDVKSAGPDPGMLGVFFNAQDENNFDAVWFSLKSDEACNFRSGGYTNGEITFRQDGRGCGNRDVFTDQWFTLSVEILPDNDVPQIYMNDVKVKDNAMGFPRKALGGIVVANRFGTRVLFRDFQMN